jgi:outer membrane protein TolC
VKKTATRNSLLGAGLCAAIIAVAGCRSVGPDMAQDAGVAPDVAGGTPGATETAAPPPAAELPLSCDAAIARAIRFTEGISRLRAAVEVARQRVAAAGDWRSPELRLSYGNESSDSTRGRLSYETYGSSAAIPGFSGREVPADATMVGESAGASEEQGQAFQVAVRFFTTNPWERSARVSGREAEYALAQALQREAEWELSLYVAKLYAELHRVREELKLCTMQKELGQRLLEDARQRSKQGAGTVRDVMDASRRYLGAVSDCSREERRLQELLGQLSALTRLSLKAEDVATSLAASEPGSVKVGGLDPETLAEQALAERADIAVLVWRSRVAQEACREGRSARIPWFSHVQASFASATDEDDSQTAGYSSVYRANRLMYDYGFSDDESDSQEWRIDTAVSLPVFYWMNNDRHVRRAGRDMARLEVQEARERVQFSITEALGALGGLEASAKQLLNETQPVIGEMETVIKNHREGTGILPPGDIARLEEEVLDAKRADLELRYEYNMAVISLREALGRPLARH